MKLPRALDLSPIWIIAGILLGVIIHIFSVLFVPVVAEHDAWTRLTAVGDINEVERLPADAAGTSLLPGLDPSMLHAVCRYDLTNGPLRIRAPLPPAYWSVALYDRRGVNYYALNDRLIAEPSIELWIATKDQLLHLGGTAEGAATQEGRLIIGAPTTQGFALFRSLTPQPSFSKVVGKALEGIECGIIDLDTDAEQDSGS